MARYSAYVSNVIDGDTFDTRTNERIRPPNPHPLNPPYQGDRGIRKPP